MRQAQELQDLAGLGGNLVDALDAHDKGELGFGGHVEAVLALCLAGQADLVSLAGQVLFDVLLGALVDDSSLGLVLLD